ncbi:MAG: nucleotide-binding universal stress UspA family protein [Desulforhopalus sp.]|jgi:nucleotide-binding universal stress UspA family protein
MDKKTKIMACIDLSEYSLMTLQYAVKLAKGLKGEILVYNVIQDHDFKFYDIASVYLVEPITLEENIRKTRKERNLKLKEFVKTEFFGDKSLMSFKIDVGVPFECILKAIDSEDIDLVVMANKGRGNISGILFGSAAEKVFRHSPVPVVSVRERENFKR